MEQDFQGKSVLVTGAASGLGRQTTELLLGRGASVLLVDINERALTRAVEEIGDVCGRARAFACDIAKRDACFDAVQASLDAFGSLDVLANVAGVLAMGHFSSMTDTEIERMLQINVAGPMYMCQAALPHIIASSGNIVNVASSGGVQGSAYIVAYSATKAALIQMTRSLAMEYMKAPIRINAVSPGPMLTGIPVGRGFPDDADNELTLRFAGIRGKERATEGVAETILFVASDRAHAVHGANVIADNGSTAG